MAWLKDGCVLWLQFDEEKGDVAYDQSGEGNNGDIHGATRVKGKIGSALSFDGKDDYVEILRDTSLEPNRITVAFWAQVNAFGVPLAKRQLASPSSRGYLFYGGGSTEIHFRVYDSGGIARAAEGPVLSPNTWYHIVGVYDGANVILYVNTIKYLGDAMTGDILHSLESLLIGAQHYAGAKISFLNGIIDEVRIYNRVFSAREIFSHYMYALTHVKRV